MAIYRHFDSNRHKVTTAIVLGIRSGTSIVSSILMELGVDMGDNFQAPDHLNSKGYFENLKILYGVNDIIGNRFTIPEPIRSIDLDKLGAFRELLQYYERDPIWGFKAPGSSYMIKVFDALLDDPRYILCMRNAREMGKSLEACRSIHDVPKNFDFTLYAQNLLDTMLNETAGKRRLIVEYDRLLEDPFGTVENIIKFLDIKSSGDDIFRASTLVDKGMKHHAH